MRSFAFIVALALLLGPLVSHSLAWSTKEHMLMTRLAAEELLRDEQTPPAMKEWLRQVGGPLLDEDGEKQWALHQRIGALPRGATGLAYWGAAPDFIKEPNPFGVDEGKLHFVDLEMLLPDPAARRYLHDLSHKPKLADIPRDVHDERWARAGYLPFRVEQCYRELMRTLRDRKLDDREGQFPRDDHAAKWAGYLAHYAQDNTQSHHATEDFLSRSYFANIARAPNVHADLEPRLLDDADNDYMPLREEFWPIFSKELRELKDPIQSNDPWQSTLEVSLTSYDALPFIGTAAMAAYGQAGVPGKPEGQITGAFDASAFFHAKGNYLGRDMTLMEMKAHQMVWGIKRTERLWRAAWDESVTPATTTTTAPAP